MLVNPENGYRVFAVRNEFEFEGRVLTACWFGDRSWWELEDVEGLSPEEELTDEIMSAALDTMPE